MYGDRNGGFSVLNFRLSQNKTEVVSSPLTKFKCDHDDAIVVDADV